MVKHIPSLAALESEDDGQLAAEIRLARLRSQVAIIRSLADHVEHLARPDDAEGLSQQIIEEMERTGHLLLQAVMWLSASHRIADSGVFVAGLGALITELGDDAPRAPASCTPQPTDSF